MNYKHFIALLLTFLSFQPVFAQSNVLDYYRLLPDSFFNTFRYKIQNKNGQWVTQSETGEEIKATVDLKNGYIRIEDQGTGGGTHVQEVAVFMKADKTPVIGIVNSLSEILGTDNRIAFYEYSNKTWKEVTRSVFPGVPFNGFMREGYDLNKLDRLKDKLFISILYQLPQYGTTIKAKPGYSAKGFDDEDEEVARQFGKDVKYIVIEFTWNKVTGKFEKGQKLTK